MESSVIIPAGFRASRRKLNSYILLMTIAVIIGTFLRISLLFIYPFIAFGAAVFYNFRVSSSLIILVCITAFGFLLSFLEGGFLKYKALSLFYMLPFLLLLFSKTRAEKSGNVNHLSIFFSCLTVVALVNDVIGIVQVIRTPNSDDSFTGIYSLFSISLNGLMILNTTIFYYYFVQFLQKRKIKYFIATFFFGSCAVLGFYGAGLIICIVAFILSFFRFRPKDVIRTVSIGLISLVVIYYGMLLVKPIVVQYNKENLQKIRAFDPAKGPRKISSFYNYAISYPRHVKDFLFGSGPGTFNSRSAFMVGSPSYFQAFAFIKDSRQPYYFKNYAYSLWNDNNTSKALYLDGFRNQPFSSILAFLGEYGLIFTVVFFFLYYRYYKVVSQSYYNNSKAAEANISFRIFKFLIILLPLLLLIDNYFEYPEIMLLILPAIRFADANLLTIKQNPSAQ